MVRSTKRGLPAVDLYPISVNWKKHLGSWSEEMLVDQTGSVAYLIRQFSHKILMPPHKVAKIFATDVLDLIFIQLDSDLA